MAKSVKTAKETPTANIKAAVNQAVNGKFDLASLEKLKKSKNLSSNTGFKTQEWLPVSDAFMDATGLKGIPMGHITLLRGHSDTGKTTLLIEGIVAAQKAGKLPVIIVTEMKWSFSHAKMMGMEVEEVVDEETGEVTYQGPFIYVDRGSLESIEDVAEFIADILEEQKKGIIKWDCIFFWDSIGSIPCRQSIQSNKNNNEWNAGSISVNFGGYINQRIALSRKSNYPFTNSLVCVNKIWVMKPSVYGELPKLKNKNGETMWSDSSVLVTFGNVTSQGTTKIKATRNGKEVEFGKRTKVQIEKNHISGITTSAKVIATPHGFIKDDKKAIDKYKKEHAHEWATVLGDGDFDIVEVEDTNDLGFEGSED
jgi:RecA/RadA recombinase